MNPVNELWQNRYKSTPSRRTVLEDPERRERGAGLCPRLSRRRDGRPAVDEAMAEFRSFVDDVLASVPDLERLLSQLEPERR